MGGEGRVGGGDIYIDIVSRVLELWREARDKPAMKQASKQATHILVPLRAVT